MAAITPAALIAAINALTDAEHVALRAALRARVSPEAAAASEAYKTQGHPCTATPACKRSLRTAKGAASHDSARGDAGWHNPG